MSSPRGWAWAVLGVFGLIASATEKSTAQAPAAPRSGTSSPASGGSAGTSGTRPRIYRPGASAVSPRVTQPAQTSPAGAQPATSAPIYGPTLPPPRTQDNTAPVFFPATPSRARSTQPAKGAPVYRGSAPAAAQPGKTGGATPVYSGAKPTVTAPAAPTPGGATAPGQEGSGSGIVVEGTAQPAAETDGKDSQPKEQTTNLPPTAPALPPPVMTGLGIPSQGNVMTGIVKPVYTQPGIMSQGNIVPGIYAPGAPSPGTFGAYGYGMSAPNVHTSYNPYNPGTSYRPPGTGATPYTQVTPGGITYGAIGYGNMGYNGAGYGGFGSRAYTPYFGQTGVAPGAVFYTPPPR